MMTFEDATMEQRFRTCRLDELRRGDTCLAPAESGRCGHCAQRTVAEVRSDPNERVAPVCHIPVYLLGSGHTSIWRADMIVEPVTCLLRYQRQECSKGPDDAEG